jgi:hypothetical protein
MDFHNRRQRYERDMEEYTGPERRQAAWHLSKKVPVAFLLALIFQGVALLKWAYEKEKDIALSVATNVEQSKRIDDLEKRERDSAKLTERMVRLETLIEVTNRSVARIEDTINNSSNNQEKYYNRRK